ncbi:DUF397 domain-containing protein [Salinispora arenicola]|uniref:DUF397 domain-containing protein n=1 Tax=Salinispora arenicola TaxID=168697 RepID=UPI0009B799EF|nr:DUF397 domain-containing protein [Salinispora arenicola]
MSDSTSATWRTSSHSGNGGDCVAVATNLLDREGAAGCPTDGMYAAVSQAERTASERFAPDLVVRALRRVLSVELAGR